MSLSSHPRPPGAQRPWFVAGASGYTGQAVVGALRAAGVPVVAHIRPGSAQAARLSERFTALGAVIDQTPWQAEAITARIAALAPRGVFALLGTTRARAAAEAKRGEPPSSYASVDRDLTLLLLRACIAEKSDPRVIFVYLSSMGADRPGGNAYLMARHRVEAELRVGSLPHLIARPAFITGPDRAEDRPAERWGAAATDGLLGLARALGAAQLADRLHSIDAAGLARALVHFALEAAAQPPRAPDPSLPAGRLLDSIALQRAARGAP